MTPGRSHPEILNPPGHPPACCTQQTLTTGPDIAAKTQQKHDYPPAAHRRSYTRRTSAERGFSTIKDPASNSIARGWCPLMGLTPTALWLAVLHAVRNQRILAAWNARHAGNNRRATAGLPPRTRKRRRKTTLASLTAPPRPDLHTAPRAATHQHAASQPRTPRPKGNPGQHTPATAMHQENEDQLRPRGQATEMSDLNVNMVPPKREDLWVGTAGFEPVTPRL